MRTLALLVGAVLLLGLSPSPALADGCLVTLPPSPPFVPPAPYTTSSPGFWFGSDDLWIHLPLEFDANQGQKVFVWSKNYKSASAEPKPDLVITSRRLDGDAPRAISGHATNVIKLAGGPAMLLGMALPTVGCWELTAYYRGASLVFIVSVDR